MKKQSGRSMLEMLGVLAIVGVLSIAGVTIFQKAMLMHRTNLLVEDMRLAGFVVLDGYLDKLTLEEMSLEGKFDKQTPYEFMVALENETGNTFVISADEVGFNVCEEVIKKQPQWAEEIVANGEENACHEGANLVTFFFNDDLGKLSDFCMNDDDCGDCSECKDNRCKYGFRNKEGQCKDCDDRSILIYDVKQEECARCPNRMWGESGGRGRCITCVDTDNYRSAVPYEECIKCPNHHSEVGPGQVGVCWQCMGDIDPVTGKCDTMKCDFPDDSIYGSTREDCQQCDGRFFTSDGRCLRCMKTNGSVNALYEECTKCPNQFSSAFLGESGKCVYCPEDVDSTTGLCNTMNCESTATVVYGVSQTACEACGNRFYGVGSNRCIKCMTSESTGGDTYWGGVSFESCLSCPHQSSAVSPGQSGYCSYCPGTVDPATGNCNTLDCNSDQAQIFGVTREQCNQCGNRFYGTTYSRCIRCMTSDNANNNTYWGGVPFEECLSCPHQASDVSPGQTGTCRYCVGTVNRTTGKCVQ